MIEIYVAAAFALLAAGAAVGILAIFAVGIHREDKAYSLGQTSPNRIAGGLRTVMDAYVHPQLPELATRRRNDVTLTGAGSATLRAG